MMILRFIAIATGIFCIVTAPGFCMGNAGEPVPGTSQTNEENKALTTIIGRLRLVGSSRFSKLVITTDENVDYYIRARTNTELQTFLTYQSKMVVATGTVHIRTKYTPDRKYAVTTREIFVDELNITR